MLDKNISDRMGLTITDVEYLWRGEATKPVADRLGVDMADVDDFLKGRGTERMRSALGLNSISAVDELAKMGGPQGAAAFICGLFFR